MKEKEMIIEALFKRCDVVLEAYATIKEDGSKINVIVETEDCSFEVRYYEEKGGYKLIDTISFDVYEGDSLEKLIKDCYKETLNNDLWFRNVIDNAKRGVSL